jgi:phosphatidylglycerol:prolipoprotein diacylglycerol transferase
MFKFIKVLEASLPVFNICIGIELIIGLKLFEKEEKQFNTDKLLNSKKELLIIAIILGGFLSAALLENIYHKDFSKLGKYGITFYGGLIFSLIFSFVYFRFSLTRTVNFLNLLVPSLFIAHSFGRIGCFFAGCCYGVNYNDFFVKNLNLEGRFPVQIVESLILILGYIISKSKINFSDRTLFYFLYYPPIRYFIEILREDDRGVFFNSTLLSPSQYISLILVLLCLIIIAVKKYKNQLL